MNRWCSDTKAWQHDSADGRTHDGKIETCPRCQREADAIHNVPLSRNDDNLVVGMRSFTES